MRLALDGLDALRVLRDRRRRRRLPHDRCALPAPSPEPRRRWTRKSLPLGALLLAEPPSAERPLHVAVPSPSSRVQASFASCRVMGAGLPDDSFLNLGDGLFLPAPEPLFLELAEVLPVPVHALLGYELCGTFSRDPLRPRTGDVTLDLSPLTSVERIERFVRSCRYCGDTRQALATLAYVADNAWSPMEALLATMLSLPVVELGYGLGPVTLNARHYTASYLVERGCPASRVPDIELVGLPLGFNYDGRLHLDLASIAKADGPHVETAVRQVREKYLDDLRRNRELTAMGVVTLPVTSEDLFREGGCDALVFEALSALGALGFPASDRPWGTLVSRAVSRRRQELLWSLLPWAEAPLWARELLDREKAAFAKARLTEEVIAG